MERVFDGQVSRKVRCERCGKKVLQNEIITIDRGSISPAEHICYDCNNQSIAARMRVNYIPLRNKTLTVIDDLGTEHLFSLTQVIHNTGIGIVAEEITNEDEVGYRFSVHGSFDEKQSELLEKLTQKIKKNISVHYIRKQKFGSHTISTVNGFTVAGRVEANILPDSNTDNLPMVIIDGKPYTWAELGEMIKRFDGFQFKLRFLEMTDDLI